MEYYNNKKYREYAPIFPQDHKQYIVTLDNDNTTIVVTFPKNCERQPIYMGWDSFFCIDETNHKKYLYMLPDVFEGNQPTLCLLSDEYDKTSYIVDAKYIQHEDTYDILEMKNV